jgi:Glycosyl hydrolases family 11
MNCVNSLGLMAVSMIMSAVASFAATATGTTTIDTGNHKVYAWQQSGQFAGGVTRITTGDITKVRAEYGQTAGGYDFGVAKDAGSKRVDTVASNVTMGGSLSVGLNGSGKYWAGPKFDIIETQTFQGLSGNYECYIVESWTQSNASQFVGYIGNLTYRYEASYNGATYKVYTKPYSSWTQIYSVRQSKRFGGTVNIGQHLRDWRSRGIVPNWYMASPKMGIETFGQFNGSVEYTNLNLPAFRQ